MRQPKSMSELVYFTRRKDEFGLVKLWVFRENCPSCNNAQMGKPVDPKTKKVKSRAKEYVCPECNHIIEKEEYEDSLDANIEYTCPEGHSHDKIMPFKRQKISIKDPKTGKNKRKLGITFNCQTCDFEIKVPKLK